MNTFPKQADQSQESKIPINVVTFTIFDGEIPKEETCKIQWSPTQGALLVAGIQMTGFVHPQLLEDRLRFTNCEIWRINRFRYVLAKWCSSHNPTGAVTPSEFLEWYENNPVPPLDNSGRPIKARASVSIPAESLHSLESAPAGDTKVNLRTSDSDSTKRRRSSTLRELISHASKVAGSDEPTIIFSTIIEWAEKKQYSLFFTEQPDGWMPAIEPSNDTEKPRTITPGKIRGVLRRMGKESPT